MRSSRWCAAGLLGLAFVIFVGCKREDTSQPGSNAGGPPPGPNQGGPPQGFTPPMPLVEMEPHAAGKKVYNANACFRCHSLTLAQAGPGAPKDGKGGAPEGPQGGPPGGPKGGPPDGGKGGPKGGPPNKGPDLTKVASVQGRDVEWFIARISDPKKENINARMPPFGEKIKSDDMRALAEFLVTLK